MENKKLNEASDFKFVTRKCNTVNDQSNANYDAGNGLIFITSVKSNLYDYNDAYILVKGDITVIPASATKVSF